MKSQELKERLKKFGGKVAKKFVLFVVALTMISSVTACSKNDPVKDPSKPIDTPIVQPDQPSIPDQPDQPDKPDQPDQPEKPDQPDQPDKPDKPDQPDKPEIDEDLDATAEDIKKFETALEAKVGEIDGYDILGGVFYCYGKKAENTTLYSVKISEKSGFEKKSQVEKLTEDIGNIEERFTILSDKNYIEYEGKKYNINAIKGSNIFAERLGITADDQSVTSVAIDINGTDPSMIVAVVNGTKTTIGAISANSSITTPTESDVLDLLTSTELSNITEKTTIPFGTDISRLPAETPEAVEKPPVIDPVEELDFTKLEEKIKASGDSMKYEYVVKNLLGYNLDENGNLVVLADISRKSSNII